MGFWATRTISLGFMPKLCVFRNSFLFRLLNSSSSGTDDNSDLPAWFAQEIQRNDDDDDDFVLPEFEKEMPPALPKNCQGTGNLSKTHESEVSKISAILRVRHASMEEVQRALDGSGCEQISEETVEQILRRFSNDWASALGFFKWAQIGGMCRHTQNAYNMMVDILGKMKQFQAMWELMEEMRQLGEGLVSLDTFIKVMRRYAGAEKWRDVTMAFHRLEEFGIKMDTDAMNVFLDSLCKERRAEYAWDVFQDLKTKIPPNAHTFNILIHGWCKAKKLDEAEWTIKEMRKHGFEPCVISYTSLVEAYCHQMDFPRVEKLLDEMQEQGPSPNVVTYTIVMHALGKAKETQQAFKIYDRMKANGCAPDVSFYNSVIYILGNSGRLKAAYEVFQEMSKNGFVPNVATYNTLLSVHCENLQEEKALSILKEMQINNCKPSIQTYNPVLKMFCKLKRTKIISYLLDHMICNDCSPDLGTYTLLVHGLCRVGKLRRACQYFEEMVAKKMIPKRDTNALLQRSLHRSGYYEEKKRIENLMREALSMKQLGRRPINLGKLAD